MFDEKKFGLRLTTLRKDSHANQQALGDALGVTKATISRLESGDRVPSLDLLCEISAYFGVPVDFLCNRPPFESWEQLMTQPAKGALLEMMAELAHISVERLEAAEAPHLIALFYALFARVDFDAEKVEFDIFPRIPPDF